jgi:hypothetical protein
MTNEDSGDPRLSKFSNADRRGYRKRPGDGAPETLSSSDGDPSLANLLETAIRGGGLALQSTRSDQGAGQNGDPGSGVPNEALSNRLLEELNAAQAQIRAAPQPPLDPAPAAEPEAPAPAAEAAPPIGEQGDDGESDLEAPTESRQDFALPARAGPAGGAATAALSKGARALLDASGKLSRRMRIRDWRRRRLALLSVVHRHVFDRNAEQLLFCKSPPLEVYQMEETEGCPEKLYVYKGPVPKKLLEWALSALPEDLKRFAFVDFRAGNGRTMLLAARRNFEYAAGYAFDAESAEMLEMNLAQYPRSYLSCRDVRALRADREGVLIPRQPAVLFFPDCLSLHHVDIILSYVLGSFRLDPRPIFLIFENAGRERGRDGMEIFERAPLPVLNRAKALFLSPVKVAVYRSKVENTE